MNLRKEAKIGKLIYYYDKYKDYCNDENLKLGIIKKIKICPECNFCKKKCGILIGIDNKEPRCFYYDGSLIIKSISEEFINMKEFII